MFREAWTAVILWLRVTVAIIVALVILVQAALKPLHQTARDLLRPFCEITVSPVGPVMHSEKRTFICSLRKNVFLFFFFLQSNEDLLFKKLF